MVYNSVINMYYYTVKETQTVLDKIKEPETSYGKKIKYFDITCTFDIETTSFKYKDKEVAIMYAWMFCLSDTDGVFYPIVGRTWDEFEILMSFLYEKFGKKFAKHKAKYYLPIFIHNLAFESTFMHFFGLDIFAPKKNKPLYARLDDYGIEFRCSYFLSNTSLSHLPVNNNRFKKLEGYRYDLPRHFKTKLTEFEKAYCLTDVLVLAQYINEKRLDDCGIGNMPRTATGYVRRGLRVWCVGKDPFNTTKEKKNSYSKQLSYMKLLTASHYMTLKDAFQGGYTHCNTWLTGEPISCKYIVCWDIISSYPASFVFGLYPVELIDSPKNPYDPRILGYTEDMYRNWVYEEDRCVIAKGKFKNLRVKENKSYAPIIPSSKCKNYDSKTTILNNGKVVSSDYIEYTFTELDYENLTKFYDWDVMYVADVYIYRKGRLPKVFIEYVLHLYKLKTELKGLKDEDSRRKYALVKALLNALYGCCVLDIGKLAVVLEKGEYIDEVEKRIRDEEEEQGYRFDWDIRKKKQELYKMEAIKVKVDKYNNSIKQGITVSCFEWGIYCSAWSRYKLIFCIRNMAKYWLYSDSDSMYLAFGNSEEVLNFVNKYNSLIKEQMESAMKYYELPIDTWRPKNKFGKVKPLGYLDIDSINTKWQGVRAKSYIKNSLMYDTDEFIYDYDNITEEDFNREPIGEDFSITVSGLSKTDGRNYMLKTWGNLRETKEYSTEEELKKDISIKGGAVRREGELIVDYYNITDEMYDNFQMGLDYELTTSDKCFEVPAEETGKLTHKIFTDTISGEITDYLGETVSFIAKGGTYLEPCAFSMSPTDAILDEAINHTIEEVY